MAIASPLPISFCPSIKTSDELLIASTGWLAVFLSLGLSYRQVVFNRTSRMITIKRRVAWFSHRTEEIAFKEVLAITYGYRDANITAGWSWAHNMIDRYFVGLAVAGRGEIELFTFTGDGEFTNDGPMPDWWYLREHMTDLVGSQERDSRWFVQELRKMLAVTIAPSGLA